MVERTFKRVIQTTTLEWIQLQNDVIPNMPPKRVDSTALHYESTEKTSHPSGGSRGGGGGGADAIKFDRLYLYPVLYNA